MRPAVLATAVLLVILSSAAPNQRARADALENFTRAWLRGEIVDLESYHDDYRGTWLSDGILTVVRKPQLPDLFEETRRHRGNVRVLAFTMLEREENGDRIEVSFWHRQIVGRGNLRVETQSETRGTIIRGGPAGLRWLATDRIDYFIRHIP